MSSHNLNPLHVAYALHEMQRRPTDPHFGQIATVDQRDWTELAWQFLRFFREAEINPRRVLNAEGRARQQQIVPDSALRMERVLKALGPRVKMTTRGYLLDGRLVNTKDLFAAADEPWGEVK